MERIEEILLVEEGAAEQECIIHVRGGETMSKRGAMRGAVLHTE
jgi:hypothetical protein